MCALEGKRNNWNLAGMSFYNNVAIVPNCQRKQEFLPWALVVVVLCQLVLLTDWSVQQTDSDNISLLLFRLPLVIINHVSLKTDVLQYYPPVFDLPDLLNTFNSTFSFMQINYFLLYTNDTKMQLMFGIKPFIIAETIFQGLSLKINMTETVLYLTITFYLIVKSCGFK